MKRLTAAYHDTYRTDGYIAPLDAVSASDAGDCCRQLEAALSATNGRADGRLRNKPHLLLRWAADLVRDARVVDAVEDLLGPDLLLLNSTLFVKAPYEPDCVAWHQDIAYWDLSAERVLTVWVALTDSTTANGCVRVVPGSHREPLRPHHLGRDRSDRFVRGQLVTDDIDPARVVPLELRAGQMSIHHPRLLHSSPGNPSARLRAGLALRYVPPDVRQSGGPWRPSAAAVRGRCDSPYYHCESLPRFDYDPIARRWHRRFMRSYAAHAAWQVLRRPSLGQLALVGRMAVRRDMLRAMFR